MALLETIGSTPSTPQKQVNSSDMDSPEANVNNVVREYGSVPTAGSPIGSRMSHLLAILSCDPMPILQQQEQQQEHQQRR